MFHLLYTLLLWGMPGKLHELKIGDRLPDQVIHHVVNYKSSALHLSDFKGKMLLFDFGATTCAPCIKLLPHLDSLQAEYGNKMQVFFVSFEPEEKVRQAMARNPRLAALKNIPIVTADTSLQEQFKHESAPHEAWVAPSGIVVAQTEPDYVTRENIDKVIAGEKVDWPLRHEESFDYSQPLLTLNKDNIPPAVNREENNIFYTAVRSYIDGVSRRQTIVKDSTNRVCRVSYINYPVIDLYFAAWDLKWWEWPKNRIKVISGNMRRFYQDSATLYKQLWEAKYDQCFEATFPLGLSEVVSNRTVQKGIDYQLNMQSSIDTLLVDCWVLRKGPNISDYYTKTYSKQVAEERARISGQEAYKDPFTLAWKLNFKGHYPPVVDETGLNKEAKEYYIDQVPEQADFETVKARLKYFGLDLIKEKRRLPFLVIKDLN